MQHARYTYLISYSFIEEHSSIRDAFRNWLKATQEEGGGLYATFCDESTYGITISENVGEMRRMITAKLKEFYNQEETIAGDYVNLFCSALYADFNVQKDNSTRNHSFEICQYKIIDNGQFV